MATVTVKAAGETASVDYAVGGGGVQTVFGSSAQTYSGETQQAAYVRVGTALGLTNGGFRHYWSGAPSTSWPPAPAMAGKVNCVSFKLDPVQVVAGAFDKTLHAFFASLPTDVDTYWSYYHEADVKVIDGLFTIPQWQAAFRYIYTLSKTHANPHAFGTMILTGWQLASRLPSYYVGDAYCDAIGIDPYRATATQTTSALLDPLYQILKAYPKRLLITETGDTVNATDAGRASFVRGLSYAEGRFDAVWYFNSRVGGQFEIDTMPLSAAAYSELAA
jgi:hypothetical protein